MEFLFISIISFNPPQLLQLLQRNPIFRIFFSHPINNCPNFTRSPFQQLLTKLNPFLASLLNYYFYFFSFKRWTSIQHCIEDYSCTEDIDSVIVALGLENLRGHVAWGSAAIFKEFFIIIASELRKPEISYFYYTLFNILSTKKNVFKL